MQGLMKDFEVEPKHPSEKALRRWRKLVTLFKEQKQKRKIKEKIEIAHRVQKAALDFIHAGSRAREEELQSLVDDAVVDGEELQSQTNDVLVSEEGSESSVKDTLAWILVVINFILEIPSLVFDQLSSKRRPQFALISMLISALASTICIVELIWKVKSGNFKWKWGERIPWFYCRRTQKPFGTLWQFIAVACAVPQCIITAINYSFFYRHHDGPIKISVWPFIFALGLFFSKLFEPKVDNLREPHRSRD